MSRRLAAAARRLADQQTDRLADRPTPQFIATVTSTSPLTVSWRGSSIAANGHYAAYTPGVGDRVSCELIDSQVIVRDRIV